MKNIFVLAIAAILPLIAQAKPEAYKVNADEAKVIWEGKKIIGDGHTGELKVKSGQFMVEKSQVKGGEIVIDMTSLKNTDITDEGMNAKLVGHLKSDDFFSIEKNPTATIKVNKVEKKEGDTYNVSGDLTIKGIKKPITFPATIHVKDGSVHTTATIVVDRLAYNVRYNSLKFFSKIGDKAINDTFTVKVDLTAKK